LHFQGEEEMSKSQDRGSIKDKEKMKKKKVKKDIKKNSQSSS